MDHLPRGSALRRGRYSQFGQIYLVTTVTRNRQPVFTNFVAARHVIRCLAKAEALNHATSLAFVVMPDHLHWMFQLIGPRSLSDVVRSVKSVSAHRIGRPIWQEGFHDHALRHEEDIPAVARYIVANPLRAGLVSHVGEYPHWDAVWL